MSRPNFGFRPIGLVAAGTWDGSHNGLPVLGRVAELRDLIQESGAECVFVAASALTVTEMGAVAKAVRLEGIEVRITASLPEVLSSRLSVQPFGGVMALSLKPVRLTGSQAIAKRAFDLVVSSIGLLLLSPFLAAMAIAVRFSSPGPVLYRQRRIGKRGRPFTMLKFRSMENGAEAHVEELRLEHGVADVMFKLPDDPRVTAVGQMLRRFSLDELPQLFNVLRGEMSLVGPRPPLPEEVAMYEDWQFDRLEVRPGITGLWQVSGRSELSFEECVRLDLFYIENWSLAYDHYIIAKTIPVLFSRRGAY
jgi:exopolysaccharide biosynthesis polyprenyl glycosylphosphotransferase